MHNRKHGFSVAAHTIAIGAMLMLIIVSEAQAAELTVSNAWIRALPPSVPSGGYFTLHNGGDKNVSLTGAQSPACGMLMLHKSENHGGMGGMAMLETVDVAPGGTVYFAPGGYHLMCMDSKPMLKPVGKVPVTLQFAGGASLTALFDVRTATGR
jgi:copper(I)-binding protein